MRFTLLCDIAMMLPMIIVATAMTSTAGSHNRLKLLSANVS